MQHKVHIITYVVFLPKIFNLSLKSLGLITNLNEIWGGGGGGMSMFIMLKNKIQLSKFGDLIVFIKQFMNSS